MEEENPIHGLIFLLDQNYVAKNIDDWIIVWFISILEMEEREELMRNREI